MVVILCHASDAAALWLHDALRRLGVEPLELVTVEQLVYSRRIVHRLDGTGDSGTIELADRRVLRPEAIAGLVNRVQFLPTDHFAAADAVDRAYAVEELGAFMLAWLDAVSGRVINPARPSALGGGAFPEVTMVHAAATAGLPIGEWRRTDSAIEGEEQAVVQPTHAVIVHDGEVFGPPIPQQLEEGCRRLTALLGVPLLQVVFGHSSDAGWRFAGASGFADFRIGGAPLAAALARSLGVERGE